MSESIRLQLKHLLNTSEVEPAYALNDVSLASTDGSSIGLSSINGSSGSGSSGSPPNSSGGDTDGQPNSRKNIHIEQLAALMRKSLENNSTEELNDVLHEMEQQKEQEIKALCEDHNNPLLAMLPQLSQVNSQARDIKSTIVIVRQQMERSSKELIDKVTRHVHMNRTRVNIEKSLNIVRLCLMALEHTNQVQELLKSNHKVAAVQNLQDLQSMELSELKHIGMGTLISQAVSALSKETTAATLNNLSDFFDSRALKEHLEEVGKRAYKLLQAQRKAWDATISEHKHLCAFRFNSPVELAYRRANENYLTESQLKVDLGPLCEAEMVFTKLGQIDQLESFIEARLSRFSDSLTVSDVDKLLASMHKLVGFCLFDRILSRYLPATRQAKLVDDTWEKLAQNISGVIGSSIHKIENYKVLKSQMSMLMDTLQTFDFNMASIQDLFRTLLKKLSDHIVAQARKEFNNHWVNGDHMQMVITTPESYDYVMKTVWYNVESYEERATSDGEVQLPKPMPFSEIYVLTCRHLKVLIEYGNTFLDHFQHDPGFVENMVSNAIDTLLKDPVCVRLADVAKSENREMLVQTSINLQLFTLAAAEIEHELRKLRGFTGRRGSVTLEAKPLLERAVKSMETRIHVLVEETVRELIEGGFDWTSEDPSESPSPTILELTTYLLTMANTILKRMPPETRMLTYFTLIENIGAMMCQSLYEVPADYTAIALDNFALDLDFLETSISQMSIQEGPSVPSETLIEARQIMELLRSGDPTREFRDPEIRNRKYGRLSLAHATSLIRRIAKSHDLPNSPDPSLNSPKQQGGFMRYLSGER